MCFRKLKKNPRQACKSFVGGVECLQCHTRMYCIVLDGIAWYLKYCMVFEDIAWYLKLLHGIVWNCVVVCWPCLTPAKPHTAGIERAHPVTGGYGALLRWVYSYAHLALSQNTVLPRPRWFSSTSWLEVPSGYYPLPSEQVGCTLDLCNTLYPFLHVMSACGWCIHIRSIVSHQP